MSFLSHTKIITKIMSLMVMLSMIIGGIVWFSTSKMAYINQEYVDFLHEDAQALADSRRLNRFLFESNYYLFRMIAETSSSQMQKYDAELKKIPAKAEAVIAEVKKMVPAQSAQIDGVAERARQYFAKIERVRALALANQNDQAVALTTELIDPIFYPMTKEAIALSDSIQAGMNKGADNLSAMSDSTRWLTITLAAAGMGFGILMACLVVVFGITRPMQSLVQVLQRMAKGDTDAVITEIRRGDEIGVIGRAVDGIKSMVAQKAAEQNEIKRLADEAAATERRRTMVELADSFESAVGGIVRALASSATELQSTAQAMTTTATETAHQSTTAAAAAEQAATNVNTVAAAAEELGASVSEIGRQVGGSASLAQTATSEASATAALVNDLSQAASRIGDVVSLISNIAGQTNLLALNATIEAARAGEAGRGFAVVAAEVKELAAQTSRATDEITGQISHIQGATEQAVKAIDGISRRIQEINSVSSAISTAVDQQGSATQEIVRNVTQAAVGTTEVTQNITGVAAAAEETGAAASQVLTSASELSRQSERLGAEVSRFLDNVRAA